MHYGTDLRELVPARNAASERTLHIDFSKSQYKNVHYGGTDLRELVAAIVLG
jgi:hypothetical protein